MRFIAILSAVTSGLAIAFAVPALSQISAPGPSGSTITYYVSAESGNDGFSGRAPKPGCTQPGCDGPFKSFHQAKMAVRALAKTGLAPSHRPLRSRHLRYIVEKERESWVFRSRLGSPYR